MFQQLTAIGRLGKDPESRTTPGGATVTNFSIAVSERWKDKQTGEQQERTEWINCVAWNRTAEIASEYLQKGHLVMVLGKLQTRKWQDKEGNDRYTTEVKVDELKLMPNGERGGDNGQRQQSGGGRQQSSRQQTSRPAASEDFDDDIPF